MAELTQITGGVLDQDLGAVGFTTPGGLSVNTRWTDLGLLPSTTTFNGIRLNVDNSRNIRRFQSSSVSGNDQNSIETAFGFARNTANAVTDPDRFFVITERGSGGTPLRALLCQVLNLRDTSVAGSRRLEIVVDIDPSGDSYVRLPGASVSNYSFAFEAFGDVTSTRNMNFDGDITLRAFPNIPLLGTDSNGRLVRGVAGNISRGDTLPTDPDNGDVHKLTAPQTVPGATMQGFLPVMTNATLLTLSNYGTSSNTFINASGYINFQINGNRSTTTPLLTGTNGNNPLLAYASGFADAAAYSAASEADQQNPSNWTTLSRVLNSTGNGNTARIRVDQFQDGTRMGAQSLWNGTSAGQVLGFVTQVPGADTVIQPSTYFWDGNLWIELVEQLADGTGGGDTTNTGDNFVGIGTSSNRRLPGDAVAGGLNINYTDYSGVTRQMDWVVGQEGFVYEVPTPTNDPTNPSDFSIPTSGAAARFTVTSADTGDGFLAVDLTAFTRRATTGFTDSIPSAENMTLVITPFNPIDEEDGVALSVTEEGGTPIDNVDQIVFDSRHFSVSDNGSGDVEVVLTASAAGGGAQIAEDNSVVAADPSILNIGTGLDVVVTNANSATETATVNLDANIARVYTHTNNAMAQNTWNIPWSAFNATTTIDYPIVQVYETGQGLTSPANQVIPDEIIINTDSSQTNRITISFITPVAGFATITG